MRKLVVFCCLWLAFACMAVPRGLTNDRPVVLNGGGMSHLADDPTAVYTATSSLVVTLDATHYASYRVKLTAPSGDTVAVSATSSTVTIPITGTDDAYVVTVDGGDYGTFDGVFSRSGAATVAISDAQALQLVKNRRQGIEAGYLYSATVDSAINDNACPINPAAVPAWLSNTQTDKWLIFNDRHSEAGVARECTYCYVPKVLAVNDSIPFASFESRGQSRQMRLSPLNFTMSPAWQQRMSFAPRTGSGSPIATDTRVIIIHTFDDYLESAIDYQRRWNECCQFYNILTQMYGVPKQNIQVVMEDINPFYDFHGEVLTRDFDGDGVDEFDGTLTLESAISSLAGNEYEQVIVYYANRTYILPIDYESDNLLTFPADLPERINAKYFHYVLSCDDAAMYADENYHGNNVVVTCATNPWIEDRIHPSGVYYGFAFYWLSALAHCNIATQQALPFSVDLDNDGLDSYSELLAAATEYMIEDTTTYVLPNYIVIPYERSGQGCYAYRSYPTPLYGWIGPDLRPRECQLGIRQCTATDTIDWNSPDIWIRGTDDGLVHQESECFKAYSDRQAYIYVRVTNNDTVPYMGGAKLHLVWDESHLGRPGIAESTEGINGIWVDHFPNHIATVPINDTIMPNSSVIIKYVWTIPTAVASACSDIGDVFAVSLGAAVSGSGFTDYSQHGFLASTYRDLMIRKNYTVINIDALPLEETGGSPWVVNWSRCGSFYVQLYPGADFNDFRLDAASGGHASGGSIFPPSAIKTYLRIPYASGLHNMTTVNGIFRLDNGNAWVNNVSLDGYEIGAMEFKCWSNGTAGINDKDELLNIYLTDTLGIRHEGHTVRIYQQGNGPGGGVNPGINSVGNGDGRYTLSATNITEPSRLEWLDESLNKVGEGQTVSLSRSQVGDLCVLKVTKDSNGAEAYAVAALDGAPAIELASPVPLGDQTTIRLTDNAIEGMAVRLIPVMGGINPINVPISEGVREMVVATASLPAGQYVVCLVHNGSIVQSINVIKQ